MSDKKRIGWIDTLKGFSMYTVILCHVNVYKPLRNWMVSFNMPIFFMMSGATLNIEKVKNTSFGAYFTQLVKRLLVPYVWLQFLSFLTRYAVNILGAHKEVPVKEYLLGILVGNNLLVEAPSNPMYYIYMLFAAQLGLWLVIKLTKADKKKMGIFLACFCLVSIITQDIDLPWHINGVPNVMFSIYLGRVIMDLYLQNKSKVDSLSRISGFFIALGILFLGFVLSRANGVVSIHGNKFGDEYILYLLSGYLSCVGFALVAIKLPIDRIFAFVGKNSLFYMGIHKPVLLIFEEVFEKYENEMFFVVPASIACFLLLLPLTQIANRYFPYINGNPIKEETRLIKYGKYLATAAAGAVPYLYFNNHFMDGMLRESLHTQLLSATVYIVFIIIAVNVANKWMPIIFVQDKKKA